MWFVPENQTRSCDWMNKNRTYIQACRKAGLRWVVQNSGGLSQATQQPGSSTCLLCIAHILMCSLVNHYIQRYLEHCQHSYPDWRKAFPSLWTMTQRDGFANLPYIQGIGSWFGCAHVKITQSLGLALLFTPLLKASSDSPQYRYIFSQLHSS